MRGRPDLAYIDKGCHVWPSCLSCPLERCIYDDEPEDGRAARHRVRDLEINRLYGERRDVKGIAARFGGSRRTIHRIVAL